MESAEDGAGRISGQLRDNWNITQFTLVFRPRFVRKEKAIPQRSSGVVALPPSSLFMRSVLEWLKKERLHKYWPIFSRMNYQTIVGLKEGNIKQALANIGAEDITDGAKGRILRCSEWLRARPATIDSITVNTPLDEVIEIFCNVLETPLSADDEPDGISLIRKMCQKLQFVVLTHGVKVIQFPGFEKVLNAFADKEEIPSHDREFARRIIRRRIIKKNNFWDLTPPSSRSPTPPPTCKPSPTMLPNGRVDQGKPDGAWQRSNGNMNPWFKAPDLPAVLPNGRADQGKPDGAWQRSNGNMNPWFKAPDLPAVQGRASACQQQQPACRQVLHRNGIALLDSSNCARSPQHLNGYPIRPEQMTKPYQQVLPHNSEQPSHSHPLPRLIQQSAVAPKETPRMRPSPVVPSEMQPPVVKPSTLELQRAAENLYRAVSSSPNPFHDGSVHPPRVHAASEPYSPIPFPDGEIPVYVAPGVKLAVDGQGKLLPKPSTWPPAPWTGEPWKPPAPPTPVVQDLYDFSSMGWFLPTARPEQPPVDAGAWPETAEEKQKAFKLLKNSYDGPSSLDNLDLNAVWGGGENQVMIDLNKPRPK